ncbi:MAG: hypothetical protein U0136_02645 [Bdellovibrionota bacterium]
MSIVFGTRTSVDSKGAPEAGAVDIYTVNLTVADTLRFRGSITRVPRLVSSILGRETQAASLRYQLELLAGKDDGSRELPIATLAGTVPMDGSGKYSLAGAGGSLSLVTKSVPNIPSLTGVFGGSIFGKGLEKHGLLSTKLHEYTRVLSGRKVQVTSKNIDPLKFVGLRLGAGPLAAYPGAVVNGNLDYDYDTGNWYADRIEVRTDSGEQDVITGSIKWIEDANRSANGRGQYQFNLRYNEAKNRKADDESAFFEGASDEQLFFAIDDKLPGVFGTVDYVDTLRSVSGNEDPVVVSSKVTYHLKTSGLSKPQVVTFVKLWLLLVGPTNDE